MSCNCNMSTEIHMIIEYAIASQQSVEDADLVLRTARILHPAIGMLMGDQIHTRHCLGMMELG